MALKTRRSMWRRLENALWPGRSDHRRDRLHLIAVVEDEAELPDGGLAVVLETVTGDDPDADPDDVVRGAGLATPLVEGTGHLDLARGRCGFATCRGIGSPAHFIGLVLECPRCVTCQRVVLIDTAAGVSPIASTPPPRP